MTEMTGLRVGGRVVHGHAARAVCCGAAVPYDRRSRQEAVQEAVSSFIVEAERRRSGTSSKFIP